MTTSGDDAEMRSLEPSRQHDDEPTIDAPQVVIAVWRQQLQAPDPAWLDELMMKVGVKGLCPTLVGIGARGSVDPLEHQFEPGPRVLEEIAAAWPDRPVLLVRAGLQLPRRLASIVRELVRLPRDSAPVVFPGSYQSRVDPLAGMTLDGVDVDSLVGWCSDRHGQWLDAPPADCLFLPPAQVAGNPLDPDFGTSLLIDDGYVVDREPAPEPLNESGHWAPEDIVLGHLRMRVQHLLDEQVRALPARDDRPVTLHVTHSWGGGIERWIEDFIDADDAGLNLVLVAVSDHRKQYCGRMLKLCAAGPDRGVIREFAIRPFIQSCEAQHREYQACLDEIIRCFGVSRIIVSSMIGHSLECLTRPLPTLQVLHDFFPVWPLLDDDPLAELAAAGDDPARARRAGLARVGDALRLQPRDPAFWELLASRWTAAVRDHDVQLIAPSRHVIERWQALCPTAGLTIQRLAHGFRPFDDVPASPRPDLDEPLRLVIPGRLTRGKGLRLLAEALPELRKLARLTALGCGRECLELLGQPGIDLILDYRHQDLPRRIAQLRPHAALLLSTVPETWSYTLSEMRALGVVPIATRIGSFPERIEHGEDGFLIDLSAEALIDRVRRLDDDRQGLREMADRTKPGRRPAEVVAEIDGLVPAATRPARPFLAMGIDAAGQSRLAGLLADAEAERRRAGRDNRRISVELERRTRWAEKIERQFQQRLGWIRSLESDLEQARRDHASVQVQFEQRSAWAESLNSELETVRSDFGRLQQQHLETRADLELLQAKIEREILARVEVEQSLDRSREQYEQILASRSWRMTRPLRVFIRLARALRQRCLQSPLRWPGMLGRFMHHARLRGFRQTLMMLQSPRPEPEEPASVVEVALPVPEQLAPPVTAPAVEAPEVSIIVPVYNQLHFTANCLQSLVSVRTRTQFEIIVVDDGSSDGTRRWLKRCKGIRTLRNRRNLGFIGTCNRGAEIARGRYLVFLNNDTWVTDDWLDALIEPMRRDPDVGIVGARLVFADGSLQEAGGIVFSDASGWNYGRGDDPDRPQYNFVSEADYVSGACLAIARERFGALGGFDDYYAPAYYEDTDLCFRVREQGLKVLYQPRSTVIHFEGATSGTDESSGAKRYQAINREKFRARWAKALQQHPDNPEQVDSGLARNLRYRRLPQKALVIDAVTPMPDHDSGSVRLFALLKLLNQQGFQTSFMPENLAWSGRHSIDLQQAGIEVLSAPWVTDAADWLSAHGQQLDLVIVSRHYVLAPLLKMIRNACPNAAVVFDTVDLHFLREQREAELIGTAAARRAAARTRKQELGLIAASDAALVVSEYERALLAELLPAEKVHVLSNIHSLGDPGQAFEMRRDLLFVGGFQHPPNVDAAEWLIDEILPLIVERLPGITLHLIGSKMPDQLASRRAPGLRVHGFVSDLGPYLAGCRVSLAPLRYGAGVKGKVNQAMSCGLPVVATACAAEGMYTRHGHDILMADTAEDFAAQVVRLYQDPELWRTLADKGRENVQRHFSIDAARTALNGLLEDLAESSGR
ncbi:MAG: glycosyltransferase [Wenzhouxiangellaceae bacterium]|nr:glycosyltransferase [Wenzhouxiangellaceae bacterium]